MLLSEITLSVTRAAEEHHEQVINPWWVGVIAIAILMGMLGALVAFGGGREHS
ncbi:MULTISPECIES: hypothetical protein [unclassified Nocardioides]|uniref:hypothetical protein n=1 Tax=unclassified Nocardioides TaxID=2615069 RepID=UPI001E50906A|nr:MULTISPECIES: hypothetical protein [unclassified Nocardioides]MCD4526259.1 hypothetical protein [Nocardioides sp. cx-173]MCD4534473.1 hypothetical protein [Nocardioides sp. cx-169]UGB40531.1 hypothetical protein LQ940_14220 [Nocardioides sp. cx-173]